MKTKILISLRGPRLTRLRSWGKIRLELREELFVLLNSRGVELLKTILSVQDGVIFSNGDNVLLQISQKPGWNYYPDEVAQIAQSVLKRHLPEHLRVVEF